MMLLLLKTDMLDNITGTFKTTCVVTCLCKIKLGETNDEKLTEELLNMA